MEITRLTYTTAFLVGVLCMNAQQGLIKRGDKLLDDYSYANAIDLYESAALKGAGTDEVASKLALSYWKVRQLDKAEMWYQKAVTASNAKSIDLYRYSEVLRSNAKYTEADTWLNKYNAAVGNDSRVSRQTNSATYGPQLMNASLDKVTVSNLAANSENCDMSPMMLGKELYFASARSFEVNARRRHTWNNKPFMEVIKASIKEDGQIADLNRVEGVNTSYHESNPAFGPEGKVMYFTRNNYHKGKKQLTSDKVNNLKMFSREKTSEGWVNEKNFPYNSNEYSVGHPTLTADGLTMFFASDMPGGQGGTDIWMSEWTEGKWSKPTNLGSNINTQGNEMFPFIHADGLLFFASDGHQGLGGLDILYSNLSKGNSGPVKNPGAPVNSGDDDFALVLNAESTRGYFTSNRTGGKGDDDIYMFDLSSPFGGVILLAGTATDAITNEPLANTHIDLKDAAGNVVSTVVTNDDGTYSFPLDPDMSFAVNGTLPEYRGAMADGNTNGLKDVDTTLVMDLKLMPESAMALALNVKNKNTGADIDGVSVSVMERGTGTTIISGATDVAGTIRSALDGKAPGDQLKYDIKLEKSGYVPKMVSFDRVLDKPGEVLVLETLVPIEVGGDLAKLIDIEPIYFDLNKFNIRPDAATELSKIVKVMKEYPNMVIELGSHTDSRGSDAYNEKLSDKRAKSSAAWIVEQGIAQERITGKGYGEAKLVNHCKNGVKCSKKEHQANRRTEFIILKM